MKTHPRLLSQASMLLLLALFVSSAPVSAANPQIDPAAAALAKELAARLGSAQTIRLTAKHKLDPALGGGAKLASGPLKITVRRPNECYVLQPAGDETRELAFDGKTLCVMHPVVKFHAIEPVKAGSIDQLADVIDERFGFRPPVAELLSADAARQLFRHVTSAKVIGTEWVGWTRCERLHFEQDGMTGDLWVGKKDKLPRRYLLTFTGVPGHPTWDIRLTKWELNVPVDAALFSKRPAADSQKVQMLKTR
jgi:hypothetical protein